MQRKLSLLILLFSLTLFHVTPAAAWLFGDDSLVTIDGASYTADDFKRWWGFYKEEDTPFPKTPDPYIDWLLLSEEAKRMNFMESPAFQRQNRIFLNSRGLLLLKYEAVDSQIDITDEDIEARYEEQFVPRWKVRRLSFKDEQTALAAWRKIADGELTFDALTELDADQGGPVSDSEGWLRPKNVDEGWVPIFSQATAGTVIDPEQHAKGSVLYYLVERKGRDAEDLELFRDSIRKELWKEEEDRLTQKLLDELYVKYDVNINEERLAALDLMAADDTFTDEPVITTKKENVSEKQFIAVVRKLMKTRATVAHEVADPEKSQDLKKEVASNIIAQAVTNWESLDRHFEEREPFKWTYEFSVNHRLGQMIEQQILAPQVEVTDEEIQQYYEENASRFTQPEIVKLFIVDETQAPIKKIWAEVAAGKNFLQALQDVTEQRFSPQEVPANHLDPDLKPVVAKLKAGDTSRIFEALGVQVMVHIVERTPSQTLPLERIKDNVRAQIKAAEERQLRKDYIEKLRANSEIEIDQGEWKALQNELGGE